MKNNPKKFNIIRAAQKRFARHGLAKTTIEEIARDLRIGKASIYHYYASKEDIFYDVLSLETDKFIGEIRDIFNNNEIPEAEKRLGNYLELKSRISEKYPLLYELLRISFREFTPEKDAGYLKTLLEKEDESVREFLKGHFGKRQPDAALPYFIVRHSWGLIFTEYFSRILERDQQPQAPEAGLWEAVFRQLLV